MDTHEIIAKGIKGSTAKGRGLYSLIPTIILVMTVSLLTACGGSSGPPTSESVVARGVITQLGSIWVNGVEYETPKGGSYSNDDVLSDTASYEVGQMVSMHGRRNDDGVSGTATEVNYEAELEGAANSVSTIDGVTILITPSTNVTHATLTDGALIIGSRYEVSGFWLGDNSIEATLIRDDDDSDLVDEVKGVVQERTSPITLTVHGVTYTYSGTPAVSVGDLVEIHFDPLTKFASIVELEDDFMDNQGDGQEVELEGIVNLDTTGCTQAQQTGANFMIDTTCIDWDSVDDWEDGLIGPDDMMSGLRVEVEGHFNADGLLIAEEIKGRGNRVRISAFANNVNVTGGSGTLEVFDGAIQVTTESGLTEIEDPISDGGGFEIRGIRTGPTSMLAIRIKSEAVDPTRHELRAEVDIDGADSSANTITVMGITSLVDANTKLKVEDEIIHAGDGTTTVAEIGDYLDLINDDNIANGPRDEVKVRIDTTSDDGSSDGSIGAPYTAIRIKIESEDD